VAVKVAFFSLGGKKGRKKKKKQIGGAKLHEKKKERRGKGENTQEKTFPPQIL